MRFPGFEGEWDKLKVRDFTRVVAGATPATDKKEYWGGVIRWMNSGELNLKRVYEVQGRITQLGYDKTSTKIIPPHSVLIGLAGQGKTRGTAAMNYVELCTNQSIASILPSDSFYSEFLYQNVESRYKELRDISSGDGGRGGLNLQMIYNLYIPHCSMQEQKKIGDFLYLLDQRIAIQNKVKEVISKTVPYSEDTLFKNIPEDIRTLYEKFRDGILELDSEIIIKFTKLYAAFKKNGSNVCDLEPFKGSLCIFINSEKGSLRDGNGLAVDVSNLGHHGNGDYRIQIRDADQYEYILSLIKQAIK